MVDGEDAGADEEAGWRVQTMTTTMSAVAATATDRRLRSSIRCAEKV